MDPNENMIARALKEQLESHIEQLKKQVKDLRDENDKQMERNHELNEYDLTNALAYFVLFIFK